MSLNIQPSGVNESQLLNFNMENISHELSALIIGGELDGFGTIGTLPINGINRQAVANGAGVGDQLNSNLLNNVATFSTGGTSTMPRDLTALGSKDTHMLQLYLQYHYQQQLHQQQPYNIFQQANYNTTPAFYDGGSCLSVIAETQEHIVGGDINNLYSCAVHQLKPIEQNSQLCTCIVTGGVSFNHSLSPKYEFHFLRCQSTNILFSGVKSMPLISSAARGEPATDFYNASGRRTSGGGNNVSCNGQRRFMKQQTDALNVHEIDYGNVVVDMSVLPLSVDNKEYNPVLRLFTLFRKMHFYLNDVLRESFVLEYRAGTLTKCSMPCTMNVQYQVKQVSRKCTQFLFEMQRVINTNKAHSLDLYLECEQSLNMLRTLLIQVESFRRIEMEHKRGQFVTEEARAQSEKLEQHLEELSDQIRETHIYVHAFNWAVERTNTSTVYNEIKEHQIGTAINYEWISKVAPSSSIPPTICDIIPNEINVDVSNDEGASVELLSSAGSKVSGFPIITVNCSEFDIERQSTRYIGYK